MLLTWLLPFSLPPLFAQEGEAPARGTLIYRIEPSAQVRYPPTGPKPGWSEAVAASETAPPSAPETRPSADFPADEPSPSILTQERLPEGWYLQLPLGGNDVQSAARVVEKLRPLLPLVGLYVIQGPEGLRLSAGPIRPSQLQAVLDRFRQAGYPEAVLRRVAGP